MIFAYILSKLLYIFSMQFISAYTNTHFYSFNKYLLSEGLLRQIYELLITELQDYELLIIFVFFYAIYFHS